VKGQNICGQIRIKNTGRQAATVSGIADSLEVHFPGNITPPAGLPSGSTPGWVKGGGVPIAPPSPNSAGPTATIDYCFSLCLASDAPKANSMRNVVSVTVNQAGTVRTYITRSISFAPPILDCQACCMADGTCTDTVPAACTSAGGLPKGKG